MKLADRVALVTGGGSGIGRAIALRFAAEGARVIVNDVREEAAAKVAAEAGPAARAHAADVADPDQVRAMFAEVERTEGRLDVLVNNAGIAELDEGERERMQQTWEARMGELLAGSPITTHWDITVGMSDRMWRRMLAVHLDGTFYCSREALRLMSRQNRGAIVNLSSVAGLMGLETVPHYSAAKAGILGLTRALAHEVASRGIRVNAICPGFVETPMTRPLSPAMRLGALARTPLGRFGQPEEIAATALFLASDDSAFYTGQWLSPNGGIFTG